jgi:hypothetical protein
MEALVNVLIGLVIAIWLGVGVLLGWAFEEPITNPLEAACFLFLWPFMLAIFAIDLIRSRRKF